MKKIVVVDDEQKILNSLQRLLRIKKTGMEFTFILGGKDAEAEMKNKSFDVLVTDLNMPGINGLELASEAKKINPDIKTIILSGDADTGLASGDVYSIVSKPCDIDVLLAEITG